MTAPNRPIGPRPTIPELLSLLHGSPTPPWTVVGQALVDLEAAGYPTTCGGTHPWIDSVVEPLGIKRASGWRYRAMARDWPWLRDRLTEAGIEAPMFTELDPATGAEQLEILIRLVKATTPEVWAPQARAVLGRTTTLRELRRIWSHYRPVLQGKTARSRSSSGFVQRVYVDPCDPRTAAAHYAAHACGLLESLYSALLERITGQRVVRMGFFIPERDHHFPGLVTECSEAVPGWTLNAVAVVHLHNHPAALAHGFVIAPQPQPCDSRNVRASVVDALWYVSPQPHRIPSDVGLLVCDSEGFLPGSAVRHEQLIKPSTRDDRLLRWLLTKGLRPCYAAEMQQAHQRLRGMPIDSTLEQGDPE